MYTVMTIEVCHFKAYMTRTLLCFLCLLKTSVCAREQTDTHASAPGVVGFSAALLVTSVRGHARLDVAEAVLIKTLANTHTTGFQFHHRDNWPSRFYCENVGHNDPN